MYAEYLIGLLAHEH